tara:strand:- start:717 stop:1055 length:339 start_codon:yes stop_codon:yes gene_type:complete
MRGVYGMLLRKIYISQGGKMVTKLVEVVKVGNDLSARSDYTLKEVFVNPDQVTMLRENTFMKGMLPEGKLPPEIDERMDFTSIHLNTGVSLIVVGSPAVVESKLRSKQLLKG